MLTTQRALKRFIAIGNEYEAISALEQVAFFAPSSLEDILLRMVTSSILRKLFAKRKEAMWRDIDLTLFSDNFPNLRSLIIFLEQPIPRSELHLVFQVFLPELYRRGMLWWSDNEIRFLSVFPVQSVLTRCSSCFDCPFDSGHISWL